MTYDNINPDHYKGGRKFEPIEVIEDWGLDYHLGNALKYISRSGRKPNEDPREGLNKAIWYLERKIDKYAEQKAAEEGVDLYGEVLDYYGQTQDEAEAWPEVPYMIGGDDPDWVDFWEDDTYDLHVTDTSVFLEKKNDGLVGAEGKDLLSWDADDSYMLEGKDLSKFEDGEVVRTFLRRGMMFGVKKDGSTVILDDSAY